MLDIKSQPNFAYYILGKYKSKTPLVSGDVLINFNPISMITKSKYKLIK